MLVFLASVTFLTSGIRSAYAAGSGYGSGSAGAPGQVGNYSNVASVQSVGSGGGTVTAVVDGATVSVTVPAGDFTSSVQIVFLSATNPTSGFTGTVELAFGVQVDQNGIKLNSSFTFPILVSVTDPAITAGSTVSTLSGSGYTTASGWTTTAGHASGSFSVDVDYLITASASQPGEGYWLASSSGTAYSFGTAVTYGSVSGGINQPVVGMASTPGGHGYWLVAADGGVFTFGTAQFEGSTGAMSINSPVVGIALEK